MYSEAYQFWKGYLPAPLLENLHGYQSMFLMDHFADGTWNPLFGELLIYDFARQDQEGFEVSPIRSNANKQ
jgi:hypothetical protein